MNNVNQLLENARQAQSSGNTVLALQRYQQLLLQYPHELSLHIVCGNLCIELQRFEEAAGYFRRILAFSKSNEARNALCFALQGLGNTAHINGQYILAEACFEEAIENQPNNAIFWYNLGNAQRELGKSKVALSSFQKSIQLDPNDADSYNNLGNVQRELGQLDLAISSYKKALEINPNLHHALVHLVHQKQHICDWQDLNHEVITIREWLATRPEAKISPFAFLAMPNTTAIEQKLCANRYVSQHYQQFFAIRDALGFNHQKIPKQRLKIGYLSADFRLHPLAFLITELIEKHHRASFEIFAYSYGVNDQTPAYKRLRKAFDQFYDIRNLSEIEAAKKIYADQIDILVDLTGFTQSSRTGIVALKPAPITINWLGYPGTMGQYKDEPIFDYLLADKIVAPNSEEFCEKPLYLSCYQPNNQRDTGSATHKSAHHLPENAFVFCSFNQTFKFSAEIFAIWMRLLAKIPNSVLWLLDCNVWAKANLQDQAALAGINKNRLIFADRVPMEAHLERHRHADLFLDTLPYNAHTTASDALWMNLPIITCIGDAFPGRVAASLLQAVQLPELICDSLEAYEEKALFFASHPEELTRLKQKLASEKMSCDLFNAEKMARELEDQYQHVWQAFLATH